MLFIITKKNILHIVIGILSVLVAIISLAFFSYTAIAYTSVSGEVDSSTIQSITFPVAELGNCANENECRAYCNDASNMQSCIGFAKDHGLMNEEDSERAQNFAEALVAGNGPGGCTSPNQCMAYCSDLTHLNVCIAFAKDNGIDDEHVDEGEKVFAYIQSGGKMPGGCTSQESCQNYCGDFSHAQECYEFAKEAGIAQKATTTRLGTQISPPTSEQFQKLSELAKTGQTPGGLKTREEIEEYCSNSAHGEECINFGVRAGFMTQDQADKIRSTGFKGPGGCNSQESCQAFCNNNHEECFKFAEEHGFSSHKETTLNKESFVRLRTGIEQIPSEVAECLKSTVGTNVLDDIQSGKLVPGSEIGQLVHSCFGKFGERPDASEPFQNAPPEVLACLKEKLGAQFDSIKSGKVMPTPEIADTFRVCFQKIQFQSGNFGQGQQQPGEFSGVPPAEAIQHFIGTAPPEFTNCMQKLGIDPEKVKTGESTIDPSLLKSCFNDFHSTEFTQPLPPSNYDFATDCKNRGGSWNGSTCVFSETQPKLGSYPCPAMPTVDQCPSGQVKVVAYSSPECGTYYACQSSDKTTSETSSSQPCPSNQYWNGTSCVSSTTNDPATTCANQGGLWDGSICVMSHTSTQQSFATASILNTLQSILLQLQALLSDLR